MPVQPIRYPEAVKMATSPVPQWAQEMSPHHRDPTAAGVLRLALLAALVALALQLAPATDRGQAEEWPVEPWPGQGGRG